MPQTRNSRAPRSAAFTIMEMMVVLGILGILIAIGLTAGTQIFTSSKVRLTQQTLGALDRTLTEYISVEGHNPSPVFLYANPNPSGIASRNPSAGYRWIPVADAVTNESPYTPRETINSVGWYLKQIEGVDSAIAPLRALSDKIYTPVEFHSTDNMESDNFPEYDETNPDQSDPHPLPTVLDAWGNPIRYVHPAFQGAIFGSYPNIGGSSSAYVKVRDNETTPNVVEGVVVIPQSIFDNPVVVREAFIEMRRSPGEGDADGGLCTSNRPYFYSCGPDGDPSTIEDNVYLVRPSGFQQ